MVRECLSQMNRLTGALDSLTYGYHRWGVRIDEGWCGDILAALEAGDAKKAVWAWGQVTPNHF